MPEFDLGAMLPGILQGIFESKITIIHCHEASSAPGSQVNGRAWRRKYGQVISVLTHMIGPAPVAESVVMASSNLATLGERLLVVLSVEVKTGDCLVKSYDALACRLIMLADPRCACTGIPACTQGQKTWRSSRHNGGT
jgi:hypothetical protein